MTCRRCGGEIRETPYGYGHLVNPCDRHHRPAPSGATNPTTTGRLSVPGSSPRPAQGQASGAG